MATDIRRVELTTEAKDSHDQRRAVRHEIVVSRASVRGLAELPADAELLDLSIYGCRIATQREHQPGDRLWLRLDGGWPIPATVVWSDAGRLGCRFDQPIAGGLVRDLTRSQHDDRGIPPR